MAPKVEKVVDSVELGEGPHWDAETQSLYFVDIFGSAIHKYVPATKKHTKLVLGDKHISIVVPVEGTKDQFLVSLNRELAVVTWDGESAKASNVRKVAEIDNTPDTLDNRFNDGKCDPSGRLWAGSMGSEPELGNVNRNKGTLISLTNGKVVTHLTGVGISNGLAFSTELKKMYYIESQKQTVDEFDFDITTGQISNRQVIFNVAKHNIDAFPDGMAIDTDGNLWVALFNGYSVIKIDPRKPETLLQKIDLPGKQVTSVAFGGTNLDELYVTATSVAFTLKGVVLPPPDHGATYRITGLGVKGLAGVKVKL